MTKEEKSQENGLEEDTGIGMINKFCKICGAFLIFVSICGAVYGFTLWNATKADLGEVLLYAKFVEQRVQMVVDKDREKWLEERIEYYDQKFGKGCQRCDEITKKTYKAWAKELRVLQVKQYEIKGTTIKTGVKP